MAHTIADSPSSLMRLLVPTLLALSLGAALASAQQQTLPKVFSDVWAPGGNLLPIGRTRGLLQTWYHGSNLRKGTYQHLGFRTDDVAVAGGIAHRMEITLGNTQKTDQTLSTTFAQNLGNSTVFLQMTTIQFPPVSRPNNPEVAAYWIKGDRPFQFTGPHLVVQVDVQTRTTYATVPNYLADAYAMTNVGSSMHVNSGISCGFAQLRASHDGSTYALSLTSGPRTSPILWMLGFEPVAYDLASLGMANCALYVYPEIVLAGASDAAGAAQLRVPCPTPSVALQVFAQVLHVSPVNVRGLGTTNRAASILGLTGNATTLYNWSRDGLQAEVGPFAKNRGMIVLLRP